MATITTTDPLLVLHQLFSPAFPVGAFAYSHGLETAIQDGTVRDAAALRDWLETVLRHGAGWSDAVLMACAARGEDVADLALALAPSSGRQRETANQGAAFAEAVNAVWSPGLDATAYPVAVGRAIAVLGLPLGAALRLYLQAVVSNLASAGVRLIPLGQTEGQRIVAALAPLCATLADRAETATTDDLGGFAPMLDIQSQRHETLYSRNFRS
ncbi:urease accessory protein UreF [Thalassococcus sp. CAU 1522]|uniref:Urease accessory protein UreF n=1 Tax=Thalassococcus arenae TaxID=2851652 RepID=A0ABS6NCD8_9RHOB|nr:urease accessory protein UreF [Thalassococcus arenae]MBV2361694.1 urease accessory protein UreF [Thalassococcus arenae]